ncbi:hypothetical protein [Nocardioides speluncae]|uniref:hypothetical protein n=1 Tax=Nocardioides speluncae TaxID=2670337 RepID=UPI000D697AB9|nr:hypothetical protein [Nocardioides speluncae]
MRLPIRPLTLLATIALAPGLLLAGASAQGTAAPSPSGPEAAKRGPAGTWTKLNTAGINNFSAPTFYRDTDGILHILHVQESGDLYDIRENEVGKNGTRIKSRTALNNWEAIDDPAAMAMSGGGVRLAFGGQRTDDTDEYYSKGQMYTATSDGTGTWTLPHERLGQSNTAYGSYGTGAVTTSSGTPVAAYALNGDLTWHTGTLPGDTVGTDERHNVGSGSIYHTTLIRDGSKVYAAWYANGSAASKQGIFVKQIEPTVGPTIKAPKSTVTFAGKPSSLEPGGPVAMVRRTTGGVYLAYCVGYPSCSYIGMWKLGTSTVSKVPGSANASTNISLAAASGGRMWVAWEKDDKVYATRTAARGLRTSYTRVLPAPRGSGGFIYGVYLGSSYSRGELVVNTGTGFYHQQLVPGLSLSASPVRWRAGKAQVVKFRATDAGKPVAGVLVKAFGKKCRTKATGYCKISFPKMSARRGKAVGIKSGYFKATRTLRIR